jgi:urocanate hydratase
MIPNYSGKELYDKYFALGVTMYGQMTAGSYCYIGPQGIVHGTTVNKPEYLKLLRKLHNVSPNR